MDAADTYRARADACLASAQHATNTDDRVRFLTMAQFWLELASGTRRGDAAPDKSLSGQRAA